MHLSVQVHEHVCVSYSLYLACLTLCSGILVLGGLVVVLYLKCLIEE